MSKTSSQLIRTIPLDDNEIETLLDRLDTAEEGSRATRRSTQRYPLRLKGCVVHIQQPGDASSSAYLVHTRNIGKNGLAFLHGGFVHAGTKIVIQLVSTRGSWIDVEGEVVHCRYLERRVHEIGARFYKSIQPSDYTSAAIQYHILLAEDDESIARLAMFHLDQLNADVDLAENGQVMLNKGSKRPYDLILCDMEMPVMDGFEAVKSLRDRGYTGKIVAATALTSPEDKQKCLEAGCDAFVAKPYMREDLEDLIKGIKEEPLISSFQTNESMVPLIKGFIDSIPEKLREIEEAVMNNELEKLAKAARSLKAEGSSFGFDPITSAATELEKVLRDAKEASSLSVYIGKVTKLCMLARGSWPADEDYDTDINDSD